MLSFGEWLDETFYPGFDCSGLTDEEYWELEDAYYKYRKENGDGNDYYA